jgi:flagellar assembly protein FliH
MPSSPELLAAAVWEPTEVSSLSAPAPELPAPAEFVVSPVPPARPVVERPMLFEVAEGAGIPPGVLAPARAAAEAAGYAAGWASGIQAARAVGEAERHAARAGAERELAQRQAQLAQALAALRTAADGLERREVVGAEHIEDLIVASAFTIAEAVVGVTLRDDATRGIAAVTRALALAPADGPVVVALSPRDHAGLSVAAVDAAAGRAVELIADASLQPGDATATCGSTSIDARIAAGLARVREVLAR